MQVQESSNNLSFELELVFELALEFELP